MRAVFGQPHVCPAVMSKLRPRAIRMITSAKKASGISISPRFLIVIVSGNCGRERLVLGIEALLFQGLATRAYEGSVCPLGRAMLAGLCWACVGLAFCVCLRTVRVRGYCGACRRLFGWELRHPTERWIRVCRRALSYMTRMVAQGIGSTARAVCPSYAMGWSANASLGKR